MREIESRPADDDSILSRQRHSCFCLDRSSYVLANFNRSLSLSLSHSYAYFPCIIIILKRKTTKPT